MKNYYKKIDGWFDDESFYDFITLKNPAVCVEVGVWKGRSTSCLAARVSGEIYAVDTFMGSESERNTHHKEALISDIFAQFEKNTAPFSNVRSCIGQSVIVAKGFKPNSCDFVFIDAEHTYEAVKADIAAWRSRVKKGGILAGHDYEEGWKGVMQAVDEAFPNGVNLWPNSSVWWVEV
jgi:predicted O-methyltransferase YrrM